jgi:hypothetical protein
MTFFSSTRLRRGIIDLAERTLLAVDRGDVDDAAEFARAHAFDDVTRHVEQRAEIGVDHGIPLIERHLVEGGVARDPGVVDEHIDRTDLGLDLLDTGRTGIERGDIPFVDGDPGLGLELLCCRVVACVACRNLVAGSLQRLADRRANASRTSRDQRNTCHDVSFPCCLLGVLSDGLCSFWIMREA